MLRNLTIHGFKSIRQKTEIEFGKVNLFIGGNGVGKSNVLEALGMLSACFGADITANELQKKGVRLSVPTLFKSAFKNSDLRINFDLNAKWDHNVEYDVSISASENSEELNFFSEHLCVNGEKIIGRSNHGFSVKGGIDKRLIKDLKKTRGLWDRFQDIIPPSPDLENQLNTLAKFAIYSPQTAFLRGTDIEANPVKPLGLNGGGLANAANALMLFLDSLKKDPVRTKLLIEVIDVVWTPGWTDKIDVNKRDPSLVSSQVKTQDATLYFRDKHMNIKRNHLSAYDSSEGTLYLLFVAVLLLHPEAPKIFALDNIDNALNPSITKKLLETIIKTACNDEFRSNNIGPEQVFLTSHNPTSLDAFDIFEDDQRIFVVSRDKQDGSTKIDRLQPPKNTTKADWIKAAGGKNLSELWIEGKIKGALGI
ncbi:MAG: ATP-binding protein [Gallionella sp.]|nr:ATP-binding protein [Gallionella sp.]